MGLYISLHQLLDEVSLMTTGVGTNLRVYSSIPLGIISLTFLGASYVWFNPRSLISGPPGSFRGGFPPTMWISRWTSHWLLSSTISVPPLSAAHPAGRINCKLKDYEAVLVSQILYWKSYLVTEDDPFRIWVPHYWESKLGPS